MANYGGRPLVAIEDDGDWETWETPDKHFRISRCRPSAHYTIAERFLSRLGDDFMRAQWMPVLEHVSEDIVREALNVHLYPMGSEPSPEYAGIGNDPRTMHDDTPDEWLTPAEYFGDAT